MLFRKKKFKSDLNLYGTAVREATVWVTIFHRNSKIPMFFRSISTPIQKKRHTEIINQLL